MDIRRRFLSKKSSGGSSGGDSSGTYTVNLNSQWEKTTAVTNPDSSLYDGVYRSSSNYKVNSGVATMYITLTGYSTFKLYIRSYAESSYDYVMVSQLDKTITGSSSYSDTTLVKAHTCGNQQSGTALSSYTLVEYTGISSGSHTITIVYRKDGSVNRGDDRGYVLIPKSSESGGGDVDIDTTYSIMYTSSDGNVATPYGSNVFGSNITSNTYVNGQGIITFDGPVTSIGEQAFWGCRNLKSIIIPDGVTSIGDEAFYSCRFLTSIIIPDSVSSIGDYAFYDCNPTSITIPNSMTSIGNYAFEYCPLTSVTIPDSVTSIGYGVFAYCKRLTSVTIGNGVASISDHLFKNCTNLTSITIPNSVTKIVSSAFNGCSNLREFKGKFAADNGRCLIKDSTIIAYANASGTIYTIPNSVTSIQGYAFAYCSSLTNVTIPNSVTSIKDYSFAFCSGLTSVYCKATTPPTLGNRSAFGSNASDRKIYVPTASVSAYKSASSWSEYADAIVGYNF